VIDSASKSKATPVISDLAMLCSSIIKVLMESVKSKQIGPLAKKGCFEMPLMLEIAPVFTRNKAIQILFCSNKQLHDLIEKFCKDRPFKAFPLQRASPASMTKKFRLEKKIKESSKGSSPTTHITTLH
jgi:hypothetical protein